PPGSAGGRGGTGGGAGRGRWGGGSSLGDRVVGLDADEIHELERPHAEAGAELGDAGAHGAGADDADNVLVGCHRLPLKRGARRSANAAMPSRASAVAPQARDASASAASCSPSVCVLERRSSRGIWPRGGG